MDSALPTTPPSDSRGGNRSRDLTTVRFRCDLSICSPPFVGADQVFTQPTGAFTSGLPTDWSPAPSPGMTTGATGQVPLAGLSLARTPTSIAAAGLRFCSPPRLFLPLHKLLQGSRGFYVRAERASLPPHAPDMLTVRIQATDGARTLTSPDSVAVGTTIARRPPHGPVLALLTHTVLTSDA